MSAKNTGESENQFATYRHLIFWAQIVFAMKRHLKAILSVLVIFGILPWMRALILCLNITKNGAKVEAKKDLESQITIQNGTLVDNLDSIEDLEPSSIKYLLKEMKKGSMQREFPIERHPESFFQVPFSFSFFTFFYFQLQSCNMQVASDPHSLINGHRGTLFFHLFSDIAKMSYKVHKPSWQAV